MGNETINHIISERSNKHEQSTRVDTNRWGGNHWKLCKKFIFDHTKTLYMHNPESVQQNDMHKILRAFKLKTTNLISARQPDLVTAKEKNRTNNIVDFTIP